MITPVLYVINKRDHIESKRRKNDIKKATGLITIILVGLIISSCDKNNAFLVNRRTATPEKIKEIEEAQQAKEEKEKGKEKVVDEKDKEKEVVKTDPGPTLVIPPIPTLENLSVPSPTSPPPTAPTSSPSSIVSTSLSPTPPTSSEFYP
ncbi:hypothetical protein AGMMS49531_08810 [Endomicrobiia bacterium]|nr:hypothetical protein AGMMS49531_08810 [Endomicrobiia bacterium]